jgi:nucleoside-diphosphate-sugar epimerase
MKRIIITGSSGQIGTELVRELCLRYGRKNVIATDLRKPTGFQCETMSLDVTDRESVFSTLSDSAADTIYHLAGILSARGEEDPETAFRVNLNGTKNTLDGAIASGTERFIFPSTIGVFGPSTPKNNVPVDTVTRPITMYGITKLFCEELCEYYSRKGLIDARGMRFPGIISYNTAPGGGTTDYAIEMIRSAVSGQSYGCFLKKNTRLPMMYMPDAIESLIDIAEAPASGLVHRTDFNVAAFDFTPSELEKELQKHFPGFRVKYAPDKRQKIADSWPASVDSTCAINEWGFSPKFNFADMVSDMVINIQYRLKAREVERRNT